MNIKGVEEHQVETSTVALECLSCGYSRSVTVQRGNLVVRGACPNCKKAALQRKHQQMVNKQKEL